MLIVFSAVIYVKIQRDKKQEQTLFQTTVCDGKTTSFTYLSDKDITLTLLFGVDSGSFKNQDFINDKKYIFQIKQTMPDNDVINKKIEINRLAGHASLHDDKTKFAPWLSIVPLSSTNIEKGLNKFEVTSNCEVNNLQNIRAYYALNDFHPKI